MADARDGEIASAPAPAPDLLEEVQRLLGALEAHPDPTVRSQVTALLGHVDAIHRTALTRLVHAIRSMAGEAFVNRLAGDPAIRLLLMSYDLLVVDRRLLAEEALDQVRGHLHGRGVDVELLEVVGGVVYVRLHGLAAAGVAEDRVRRDLQEALAAGLVGFQQLVVGDRPGRAPALLQIEGVRPARRPVYRRICAAEELAAGGMKAVEVDGQAVLLAAVDGHVHAVADRCGESPLPLRFGTLAGPELRCSWHGCRYDVRTGQRVEGGAERLAVFPVRIEDGAIWIAAATGPAEEAQCGR